MKVRRTTEAWAGVVHLNLSGDAVTIYSSKTHTSVRLYFPHDLTHRNPSGH